MISRAKFTELVIRRDSSILTHFTLKLKCVLLLLHLRWEVPRRIYGTSGVQAEAEVDCTKPEPDEERSKMSGNLHVLLVRDGQNDQHQEGRAQHLKVQRERPKVRLRWKEKGSNPE